MSLWRLFYHMVWSTRQRLPIIDDQRRETIARSFRVTFEETDAIPHAVYMMPDHVHLAFSLPPRVSVADFAHLVKGKSSRLVNATTEPSRGGRFSWQPEYGILTFSERSLPDVIAYVENQWKHHTENRLWPMYENDGTWPVPKVNGKSD